MGSGVLTRRFSAAAAVALVVAVTGCSASGGAGDTPPAACTTPGVTADQVKVGFVYSDSGTGSSALSSARAGVTARLGLVNEEGGVNGRHIIYRWRDDSSSPAENTRATAELVEHEGVFGLISATSALAGSLDTLADKRIPVTGLVQSGWGSYDNLFSFIYDVSPEITARYILKKNGRKAAIVMSGSAELTQQIAAKYRAAFEGAGLSTAPEAVSYASGSDSPNRIAQRLESAGVDSLVALTSPQDLAEIMQGIRNVGVELASVVSLT
ncbi:ABC transporter substrate-binding protein, partial [Frankia sp. EI5c]|uniref:ABC transporter substrate-binding protein n=1 Tax=Frankia sp. EI5c TaxID=683316 RepID=UPI001F5B74E4